MQGSREHRAARSIDPPGRVRGFERGRAGRFRRRRILFERDKLRLRSWDGVNVITHKDKTFYKPGKVGLWTKADSITYFDDLSVTPVAQL